MDLPTLRSWGTEKVLPSDTLPRAHSIGPGSVSQGYTNKDLENKGHFGSYLEETLLWTVWEF